MIQEGSPLWNYLSPTQKTLAGDGAFLLADSKTHPNEEPTDYSYMVFPFAKLYEGFLKQFLLDLEIIDVSAYTSDRYRIGKAMSPHLGRKLGPRSAYGQIAHKYGDPLASQLWQAWKNGRNLVFHYFPHNYRALSYEGAREIIVLLVSAMEAAVEKTHVKATHRDIEV
jgi:hypothetical protein